MTRRFLLLVVGAAALVLFVRWLGGLDTTIGRPPSLDVAVRLRDAAVVLRARGRPEAEVRARTVTVSQDLRTATFTDIEKVVIYFQGRPFLRLNATRVVFDQFTHDLRVEGITASSTRGERVEAAAAQWNQETGHLTLTGGVRVSLEGAALRAPRMVVDTRAQVVEMDGGAEVTVDLERLR